MSLLSRYTGMMRIAIRERLQFRFDFIMTLVSTIMFSLLYYMVWQAIYTYSTVHVMPWSQLITYIMVGQTINFARWSPAERAPVYGTATRIRSGDIALDLIRPIDFQAQRFTEALGFFAVEMLWVNIPALVVLILMLGISVPHDMMGILGFILSLMIGFIVAFSLNSIVMMVSFWTTNAQGVQIAKRAIVDIFAGTLIPFEFFPSWLKAITLHLPFQAMAYIPLSIYTGKLTGSAMIIALAEQIVWAAVMLLFSRFMWFKASKQITIYGG